MVSPRFNRRRFLTATASLSVLPNMSWAESYIDLDWADLVPEGQPAPAPMIPELMSHDGPDLSNSQPVSSGVRSDWNQQIVRLPGFIVPIDYSGTGVTAFILVPFVGACVHVPPPPANQLVFVTTQDPYESKGLYEPVNVIGMFGISSISTHLADVGYALSADKIEPYRA